MEYIVNHSFLFSSAEFPPSLAAPAVSRKLSELRLFPNYPLAALVVSRNFKNTEFRLFPNIRWRSLAEIFKNYIHTTELRLFANIRWRPFGLVVSRNSLEHRALALRKYSLAASVVSRNFSEYRAPALAEPQLPQNTDAVDLSLGTLPTHSSQDPSLCLYR